MRCFIPLIAALPAVALPASAPTLDLRHAPAEGTVRRLLQNESTDWSLIEIRQTLDGDPMPSEEVQGMEVACVRATEFVDRLVEARGPLALRLEREVARADATCDLTIDSPVGAMEFTVDAESGLVDETLVFSWDEEDEEYGVALESGAPIDLSGADVDAGLTRLVPQREVGVGTSWTVDGADFMAALVLGGEFGIRPTSAPVVPGDGISGVDLLAATYIHLGQAWDLVDGEVELDWSKTVEIDGRDVAVVEIVADLELARSLTELLEVVIDESGADVGRREDYEAEVAWEVHLEGELAWDLVAEGFRTLELDASGECDFTLRWQDVYGYVEIEAEMVTQSELALAASTEAE